MNDHWILERLHWVDCWSEDGVSSSTISRTKGLLWVLAGLGIENPTTCMYVERTETDPEPNYVLLSWEIKGLATLILSVVEEGGLEAQIITEQDTLQYHRGCCQRTNPDVCLPLRTVGSYLYCPECKQSPPASEVSDY